MAVMTELAEAIELDRQSRLHEVLSLWHTWQGQKSDTRGFRSRAVVCGDFYMASRQHDSENGALDEDLEARTCAIVQYTVEQLPDPWRTMAYVLARECCTGLAVFKSPRLPTDPVALMALGVQTRQRLIVRLVSQGVIE